MLDVEYASGSSSLSAAKQSGALVGAGDCSKTSEVSFHFSACLKRSDLVGLNSIAGDPAAS